MPCSMNVIWEGYVSQRLIGILLEKSRYDLIIWYGVIIPLTESYGVHSRPFKKFGGLGILI